MLRKGMEPMSNFRDGSDDFREELEKSNQGP